MAMAPLMPMMFCPRSGERSRFFTEGPVASIQNSSGLVGLGNGTVSVILLFFHHTSHVLVLDMGLSLNEAPVLIMCLRGLP